MLCSNVQRGLALLVGALHVHAWAAGQDQHGVTMLGSDGDVQRRAASGAVGYVGVCAHVQEEA